MLQPTHSFPQCQCGYKMRTEPELDSWCPGFAAGPLMGLAASNRVMCLWKAEGLTEAITKMRRNTDFMSVIKTQ